MVAARMMVPLRGDLATRLASERFWFGMEVVARCLYWRLVMAHQGWQTDGQAQRAKIRCRKRREPGTMRSEQVPSSKSQKASAGQSGLADLVAVVPFGSPKDLSSTPIATPTTGRSQA
jgi:hypothetical protein